MIRIKKMMNVPCRRGREGCLKAYGYAEARVRQSTMFIFSKYCFSRISELREKNASKR
jgi:hypothetical protein